jgi:hypothetical protein
MKLTRKIKAILFAIILTAGISGTCLIQGCGTTPDSGSDPLTIKVEQVETSATATFDLVVHVDNSDRGFWRTNAPAFHNFCEWLRAPMAVDQTNILPRGLAMVKQLDNVKVAYKSGLATSNTLVTILLTTQSTLDQAAAWSTITATNRSN